MPDHAEGCRLRGGGVKGAVGPGKATSRDATSLQDGHVRIDICIDMCRDTHMRMRIHMTLGMRRAPLENSHRGSLRKPQAPAPMP